MKSSLPFLAPYPSVKLITKITALPRAWASHWRKLSPLGGRLVSATIAFSTVVALVATAVQLYFDYRHDMDEIDRTFQQIDQSYLPTLANSLWATDRDEIYLALNGLVRLPNIQYVSVSEDARPWASAGVSKSDNVRTRVYRLTHRHKGQELEIGALTVMVDMAGVYQRLLQKFWVILISNSIKTFLVAGFMLLLFHLLVTRHLRDIALYAQQLSSDNLESGLRLKRAPRPHAKPDEFDAVLSGFAHMRTNLTRSIRALREGEERFRTVADFTYDWEYWVAPDGRLLYVSPSCERLTGYSAAEFQQNPRLLIEIMHPDDREQFAGLMLAARTTSAQQSLEFDFRIQTKNGDLRWVAHAEQAIYGSDGMYRGQRASNRDITERKQAEAQVQQLNNDLERRVSERTAELAAVNKELEAFSYSVSHDLRAPLRGIDGFSQALEEEYGHKLDATARDYLFRVRTAAQRMGLLIQDLLKLAHVTRLQMKTETVDLSAMALEIIADLHRHKACPLSCIRVQANLSAQGDSSMLRIALQNLLDNAWKYSSKKSEPKIEVGSRSQEGQTIFFVKDNGAGFDMAYVGRLFGPFQRLHREDEFPGIGVGLATVKRVIHRHGGEVWAEGQVDLGATFSFTLKRS